MIQNLDDQIRDCLRQADQCAVSANKSASEQERRGWRNLEWRYRSLAQSIDFSRRAKTISVGSEHTF